MTTPQQPKSGQSQFGERSSGSDRDRNRQDQNQKSQPSKPSSDKR